MLPQKKKFPPGLNRLKHSNLLTNKPLFQRVLGLTISM